MINEITNKVSTLDNSQKSDNKNNTREAPAKSELENRSDLRNDDTIDISGRQPVEMPVGKVVKPVSGQDIDVQQLLDAYHQEANSPDVQGKESTRGDEVKIISLRDTDNKSAVKETNNPANDIPAKEDSSQGNSLKSAYGERETEVGKVIRLTV